MLNRRLKHGNINMFPDKHDRAAAAGLARGRAGGGLLCHRVLGERGGGGGQRPCVDTGPGLPSAFVSLINCQ